MLTASLDGDCAAQLETLGYPGTYACLTVATMRVAAKHGSHLLFSKVQGGRILGI
jgi:hypothetical protein